MNREHVKGAYEKAKGAVKEAFGKLTGSKKTQVSGKMDKAKSNVHQTAGDAKDAVKHTTKQ